MKPILQSSITLLVASLTSVTLLASTSSTQPLKAGSPVDMKFVTVGDPGNPSDHPDEVKNLVSVIPVYATNPDGSTMTRSVTNSDGTVTSVPVNATNADGRNIYNYQTNSETVTLHGVGAVPTSFLIGKFDVTSTQYCAFLNAVAANSDPYGLYDARMGTASTTNTITNTIVDTNIVSSNGISSNVVMTNTTVTNVVTENQPSITRTATTNADGSTHYKYNVMPGREQLPIIYVSWFSAARFCNWMHNGQPQGDEGPATTETGAYALNGAMQDVAGDANTPASDFCKLSPGAKYFLPTEDMWVKAAYYAGNGNYWNYPTKSNVAPGNSPHGIFHNDTSNCANYFIPTNTDDQDHWYSHLGFTWDYRYANGGQSPFLTPVGKYVQSPSPYGAYDMGGNCYNWLDNKGYCGSRVIRGGSYKFVVKDDLNRTTCSTENPSLGLDFVGFRIAAPDPNALPMEGASLNSKVQKPIQAGNRDVAIPLQ